MVIYLLRVTNLYPKSLSQPIATVVLVSCSQAFMHLNYRLGKIFTFKLLLTVLQTVDSTLVSTRIDKLQLALEPSMVFSRDVSVEHEYLLLLVELPSIAESPSVTPLQFQQGR